MKRTFLIFLTLLACCSVSYAQKTFTGTVYANSMQQPLAGVSITVKGGVGATMTDKDGKFTLQSYLKSPTLIFNYKGLAVQERTYKKKKIQEVMTIDQKYLAASSKKEAAKADIKVNNGGRDQYYASQISELVIREDVWYAEKKKKIYREIKAITLVIPAELTPIGISKYVATFDINEVEQLFKDDPQIRWANPFNPLQKSDFVTALKQHWFKPKIFMYRHPVNDKHMELYAEEHWETFRNHYKQNGDLFGTVRKDWQDLIPAQVKVKAKLPKMPKKVTNLTTLWLEVNMQDSLNWGFMPEGRELSKVLLDAAKAGKLKIYRDDKLEQLLPMAELMDRISLPVMEEAEDEEFGGFDNSGEDDDWGDDGGGDEWKPRNTKVEIPIESSDEEYNIIRENAFLFSKDEPLSTFSIDVDRASYSNMRRFLNAKEFPPKDAIRIEELVNYFNYDYPKPKGKEPFAVHTEISNCPWNDKNQVVQIGLQGRSIKADKLPAMNLVFLLDVSGSMSDANKLPLLKESLKLLMEQLRPKDRVAIAVYAGAAGLVLPSTPASEKEKIIAAFDQLESGGSTAGGKGILLAYQIARQNFIEQGNNRIILATDGDFNVGVSSNADLERLIEDQRKSGVFLTVLGFGMGNVKDAKMETLADKGNGNYAYIDNLQEAKKVLVQEFAGTLFAIAKDVKIQVEFNPAQVAAYRLIGYENRKLENKDFNDDTKDAGELGAGHTVTALYEIVPTSNGVASNSKLKYQTNAATNAKDLLTVKLRYKEPDGEKSKLLEHVVNQKDIKKTISTNMQFASSVAQFGMLLRDSPYKGSTSYEALIKAIGSSLGKDKDGYRKEFEELVKKGLGLWQVP